MVGSRLGDSGDQPAAFETVMLWKLCSRSYLEALAQLCALLQRCPLAAAHAPKRYDRVERCDLHGWHSLALK
jgi:hypothetical protein